MSELLPLLRLILEDVDAGRPVGLCTVVRTRGSTPQSPGASMVVRSDFSTAGTLGGGCVEFAVRKRAFAELLKGRSALMEFVLDHDESEEDGLICGGRMTVAMQPIAAPSAGPIREALVAAERCESVDLPLEIDDGAQRLRYLIRLEEPPTLIIAGAGHVGRAVANLAVDLDFKVIVIDDRSDFASPDRFDSRVNLLVEDIPQVLRRQPLGDSSYVVIVTRGHKHDHGALDAVVRRSTGYLGLIGSRRKAKLILGDLARAGVPQEKLDRVRTPIGLPIGAVTVPEIAVSIVAQLIEQRRKATKLLVTGPS